MEDTSMTVRASIELAFPPDAAFDAFVGELAIALRQGGIYFEAGPNGRITQGEVEVGRVVAWRPGALIRLNWHPVDWDAERVTQVELSFEPAAGGTRVTLEHRGWAEVISDPGELAGWFAGEVAAPLLLSTAPAGFGDWLTDRGARRPSGPRARAVYGDPLYHYPNFKVILAELSLTPDDWLLEVGCGGGKLLQAALASGCSAGAIDHSAEMVRLAQEINHDAIAAGRLQVQQADAARLPFADETFTCAAMTGVLGFLPDPVAVFREIRRVLRAGGRFVALGSDPALRGTPAAPEPMASRLRFYADDELRALAIEAGFSRVAVVRRDMEPYALEAGVPEEHVALFKGPGGPFLLAYKD